MNVVILGCGRVGSTLARNLDQSGNSVTVIDRNEAQFNRLGHDFKGDTVRGVGIDEDVLRIASLDNADVFIAVTNGDNTNIMASQIAKEIFEVPHVVTRIYDPVREKLFNSMGLDTYCPTTVQSHLVEQKLEGGSTSGDSEL